MNLKKVLSVMLAVSMLAAVPSCDEGVKTNKGGKNDLNKVSVYYEAVDVSDTELKNAHPIAATVDKYYYTMYDMYTKSSRENRSRYVLDLETGELTDDNAYSGDTMISRNDSSAVYLSYDEEYNCSLEKKNFNDGTVKSVKTEHPWINLCDKSGNVYIFSGEKLAVFDSELEPKKEINVSDLKDIPDLGEYDITDMCVSPDGKIYFLISGDNSSCAVYRLEEDKVVNLTGSITDFEDSYGYLLFDKNGRIIIAVQEEQLMIDVIDPENGKTLDRHEIEDVNQFFGAAGKYDLIYSKDDGIFGYTFENGSEESLISEGSGLETEFLYCEPVNDKLYISSSSYDNDEMLFEIDAKTGKAVQSKCSVISNAAVSDDGTLYYISSEYRSKISTYNLYRHESGGNDVSLFSVYEDDNDDVYILDMDIDSNGNFLITVGDADEKIRVDIFDKSGKKNKEIDASSTGITYGASLMKNEKSEFYMCSENGTVYSLDVENEKVEKTDASGIKMFTNGFDGRNGYDFFYCDYAGIYGYSIKNNKSEEIAALTDMEGDASAYELYVVDKDTIISGNGKKFVKADQAKIDEMNSKTIISAAVVTSDMIKSYVDKFNEENDDIRIVLKDYSKYIDLESADPDKIDTDVLINQITAAFTQDVLSGSVPDIVMLDNFNVSSLVLKGFFADMKELIDKDPDIDFSDLYSSVTDAYSYKGKLFALPALRECAMLASGNKIEKLDFETLFSMDNGSGRIFDKWMGSSVEQRLYESYADSYVDIEKKQCDFDNNVFIDLIKFIKNNDLTKDAYMKEMQKADYRMEEDEDEALLKEAQLFSIYSYYYDFCDSKENEKKYLVGYPSADGEKATMSPLLSFGISDSSKNKDAAWKFIKQFLSEDSFKSDDSDNKYSFMFEYYHSCRKSIDEKSMDKQIKEFNEDNSQKLSDADVKNFKEAFDKPVFTNILNNDIIDIIKEETKKFYSGEASAEDTAKALQSKVSLYMSEIS